VSAMLVRALSAPRAERYLHPGELFAARGPHTVSTILGSCVSVCLWDPKSCVGGINHYVLPQGPARDPSSFRYGVCALPELVSRVRVLSRATHGLEAKVFGGASVLSLGRGNHLAKANVELARQLLLGLQIPIVAEQVGGDRGRRIIFDFQTGAVWVRAVGDANEGSPSGFRS
jgi:chemotaxis protein CheD